VAGQFGGVIPPPFLVAAAVDATAYVGAGALLLALFGYLFKELRRKDEGVWAIVADRDKRLLELTTERNYWRAIAMGEDPPPLEDLLAAPHPAPSVVDEPPLITIRRRRRDR
jgi:hypothetical protein